jgi:hypothetical protein
MTFSPQGSSREPSERCVTKLLKFTGAKGAYVEDTSSPLPSLMDPNPSTESSGEAGAL